MYWAVYLIVLFAGLAMTVREGLWSNTLTLLSIIISGLVAFGFYSPLVVYLDESATDGQHTYWLDFAIMWALYTATMLVLRTLFVAASKTRLRFKHPIDPVGGPIVGFMAAWVLAAFTLATLHTSPLPKTFQFVSPNEVESASYVTAPDTAWLKFVESMSKLSAFGTGPPNEFSAKAFAKIYADHRDAFNKAESLIVKRTKS